MKKEIRTYFRNAVQAKGFVIDAVNLVLGIVVIVAAVIALTGGEEELFLFPCIFMTGMALMILNAVKKMKQSKLLGIIFVIFAIVLAAACVFSFMVLFQGYMVFS